MTPKNGRAEINLPLIKMSHFFRIMLVNNNCLFTILFAILLKRFFMFLITV